ncbi:ComF family protein [Tunicatimonas pelagia]|uniref:ComF family protein n=1 Tax=Tunicatimonas pelagia TaxID=931531 RepID=UPI00266655A3|nr:phosphoribosyltransferase family protein [Tunicatimonas pelagia]WKN46104.1 phosphoribosyltransferase family protein [Tunicatimonas pelagia]
MLKDFLSLIFPRTCIISQVPLAKGEQLIATQTIVSLPRFDLNEENTSLVRRVFSFAPVSQAWAYYKFSKHGKVQRLLHVLKYQNHPEIGEMTGKWFGHALQENAEVAEIDLIVPLPMHKKKQKKRGYNQCDYIVWGLSEVLAIPWSTQVLVKIENTDSQTRKNRIERYRNSYRAYAIRKDANIRGKHILLVDDVVTTGATLGACVSLLLAGGCRAVSVAALASPE